MEDIRKTFTIQWVGPFKSIEIMRNYLNRTDTCSKGLFNFYYFCGNKNKPGCKNADHYRYFGIHKKCDGIEKRLKSSHEHYKEFKENENMRIWIGTFSDELNQTEENIDEVETLFINTYCSYFSENIQKKKKSPNESICIINLWYGENENRWLKKKSEIVFIDDVLLYDSETGSYLTGNLRNQYLK